MKNENVDVESYLKDVGIRFINKSHTQIVDLLKDKECLKILDSELITIVVNSEYKFIGIALKNKGKKGILEIIADDEKKSEQKNIQKISDKYRVKDNDDFGIKILKTIGGSIKNFIGEEKINYYKEKIIKFFSTEEKTGMLREFDFISIDNNKINWKISTEYEIIFVEEEWKFRNIIFLKELLTYFIFEQFEKEIKDNKIDYIISRSLDIYYNLMNISKKYIEASICILQKNKVRKKIIYKKILVDNILEEKMLKEIILTPKGKSLNIRSCEEDFFELLALSSDSIILDSDFNILSYGQKIKKNIFMEDKFIKDENDKHEYLPSERILLIDITQLGFINIYLKNSKILRV